MRGCLTYYLLPQFTGHGTRNTREEKMKKYKVIITETNTYSKIIEAKDSESAILEAGDLWGSHGEDAFKFEEVCEWDIVDCTELKK